MPMLIEHGLTDDLVPPSHSQNMVAAIQQFNPQVLETVYFEGGHDQDLVDKNGFLNFLAQFTLPASNAVRDEGWFLMD